MSDAPRSEVVVAAGGLGVRARQWSRLLPKEFYPFRGKPAIAQVLAEIQALGPSDIYFVYHPYYELFYSWMRQALSQAGMASYDDAASAKNNISGYQPENGEQPRISFLPQEGPYGDLSSLLTCSERLRMEKFHVAFADFVYANGNPIVAMEGLGGSEAVLLARPVLAERVGQCGMVVAPMDRDGNRLVCDLVEKPDAPTFQGLVQRWGTENIFMLEGRFRLPRRFLNSVSVAECFAAGEPRLSMAIRNYARSNAVHVVLDEGGLTDLAG